MSTADEWLPEYRLARVIPKGNENIIYPLNVDNELKYTTEILNEIEKVTSLVGNIARASTDQASEIAQITQGIEQFSHVVQTNSATAEESAAASQELSGQAEMLKVMVGAFKLKNQSRQQQEPLRNTQYQKTVEDQPQIILDDLEFDKY